MWFAKLENWAPSLGSRFSTLYCARVRPEQVLLEVKLTAGGSAGVRELRTLAAVVGTR